MTDDKEATTGECVDQTTPRNEPGSGDESALRPPTRPRKKSHTTSDSGSKPRSGKTTPTRMSTLRSTLLLGSQSRKSTETGSRSAATSILIGLSLLCNVIAVSAAGWFLYARTLPGTEGAVAGYKLVSPQEHFRSQEDQTARHYVNNMMNFSFQNLDAFGTALSTGISGELKKNTSPQQIDAIKKLFTTLEVKSAFTIVASDIIEDGPDFSVVAVAGHQTLNIKGDKAPRTMSTIIKATVQKKDQTISVLESVDDVRQDPESAGSPLFPVPPSGGPADSVPPVTGPTPPGVVHVPGDAQRSAPLGPQSTARPSQ